MSSPTSRLYRVAAPLAPGYAISTSLDELVARRFSMAADPVLFKEVTTVGWRAWMDSQFSLGSNADSDIIALAQKCAPMGVADYQQIRAWSRTNYPTTNPATIMRAARVQHAGMQAVLAIMGKSHLLETMTSHWLDHFSVPYLLDSEHEVANLDLNMRKVALTNFPAILKMVYADSAIYHYLTNPLNTARGINENLGRETLELYTVGAGNHSEQDVREASKLLSGWQMDAATGAAMLRPDLHLYTPSVQIMGKTYPNATEAQARQSMDAWLSDLAMHPLTAHTIAHKLCVRFVSDNPSPSLVSTIKNTYLRTKGNVRSMLYAIIASNEFRFSVGHKWKRPQEHMYASARARGGVWRPLFPSPSTISEWMFPPLKDFTYGLQNAGHAPRAWVPPNGYPAHNDYWINTMSILTSVSSVAYETNIGRDLFFTKRWSEVLNMPDETYASLPNASRMIRSLTGMVSPGLAAIVYDTLMKPLPTNTWDNRLAKAVQVIYASPLGFLR